MKITGKAVFLVMVMAFLMVGQVSAITIVVDGVKEAAWDGVGAQVPGIATDPNEPAIFDQHDIEEIRWTNDTTNFYFLIQTYGPTDFAGFPAPYIVICLDTDNSSATGGSYENCNAAGTMTGIDRSLIISGSSVTVYNGPPGASTIAATTQIATVNNITEVSIDLASLGLNSATACNGTMQMGVYFDGQNTNPDDNVPDSGTIPINCGVPTAITLQNISAGSQGLLIPLLLAIALLGTGAASLYVLARRRRVA